MTPDAVPDEGADHPVPGDLAQHTAVFRLIAGQELPDEGNVTTPDRFVIGYFSQDPAADTTEATVREAMLAGTGDLRRLEDQIAAYSDLLTDPDLAPDRMDEILETMGEAQAAEEFLAQFKGAIFMTSHDRDFLDRLSSSTSWARRGSAVTTWTKKCRSSRAARRPGWSWPASSPGRSTS